LARAAILSDDFSRIDEALVCFDRVIQMNADDFEAWKKRVNLLEMVRRKEGIKEGYDELIRIISSPNFSNDMQAGVWVNRGDAFSGLGDWEEAIRSFDVAIDLGSVKGFIQKVANALPCYLLFTRDIHLRK